MLFRVQVAAMPRLPRSYSAETRRGDAAAATWIFRGPAPKYSRTTYFTERGEAQGGLRTRLVPSNSSDGFDPFNFL